MESVKFNGKYRALFANHGMIDFTSIYNYYSDKYFTKNPLRNVVSFTLDGNIFFLKRHIGISYAKREWDNISLLHKSGFMTVEPVAYGVKAAKAGAGRSFIVTKKLQGAVSLEEYITRPFEKQKLIKDLACLAERFHGMGFCHQDFYAGHIFLKEGNFYILDLQRLLKKKRLKDRWRIKDIAQLNYTVPGSIIKSTDKIRFIKYYFGISKLDRKTKLFIRKVQKKTNKIAVHTEKLIAKGRFNY